MIVAKQAGPVTYIEYAPDGLHLAVTASNRILFLQTDTLEWNRQINRFTEKAHSGSFRCDGKLIVAGGENPVVQVFDVSSRTLLRKFVGHTRPVHCTRFSKNKIHIMSASDDTSVRIWDLTAGSPLTCLEGHTDYVRTASCNPVSNDIWLTGGYDNTVRLWDIRSRSSSLMMDHGAPVEEVLMSHAGTLAVSTGGNSVCIWDLSGGGRLLRRLKDNQNTVTCARITTSTSDNLTPQLITGCLDGYVKVYDMNHFKVSHSWKYHHPVRSMDVSPEVSSIAVGMADGTLCLRKYSGRKPFKLRQNISNKSFVNTSRLSTANNCYFIRGKDSKTTSSELIISKRKPQLKYYNLWLRRFRHSDAIDAALSSHSPEVVLAVIEELINREALIEALEGRKFASLAPILDFLDNYIVNPPYARVLIHVMHQLLDLYTPILEDEDEIRQKIKILRKSISLEVLLEHELMELNGISQLILASFTTTSMNPQNHK